MLRRILSLPSNSSLRPRPISASTLISILRIKIDTLPDSNDRLQTLTFVNSNGGAISAIATFSNALTTMYPHDVIMTMLLKAAFFRCLVALHFDPTYKLPLPPLETWGIVDSFSQRGRLSPTGWITKPVASIELSTYTIVMDNRQILGKTPTSSVKTGTLLYPDGSTQEVAIKRIRLSGIDAPYKYLNAASEFCMPYRIPPHPGIIRPLYMFIYNDGKAQRTPLGIRQDPRQCQKLAVVMPIGGAPGESVYQSNIPFVTGLSVIGGSTNALAHFNRNGFVFNDFKLPNTVYNSIARLIDFGHSFNGQVPPFMNSAMGAICVGGSYQPPEIHDYRNGRPSIIAGDRIDSFAVGVELFQLILAKTHPEDCVQLSYAVQPNPRAFIDGARAYLVSSRCHSPTHPDAPFIWKAATLAFNCLSEFPSDRPTTTEISATLEAILAPLYKKITVISVPTNAP